MSKSSFKRGKFGQLPGDNSPGVKIAMLEGKVPFELFPWQIITRKCAKSFRKTFKKCTERTFRRKGKMLPGLDG